MTMTMAMTMTMTLTITITITITLTLTQTIIIIITSIHPTQTTTNTMSVPDTTVTPTTKRMQFNFEPELSNNKNSNATSATPSAAAHDVASSGISALHPTLRTIAETQLLRFMKLYSQQTRQLETIDKLNIDSFIPRSARLAFTIKASATTTETSEFATVAASSVEYIETVQHNLKQFILQDRKSVV